MGVDSGIYKLLLVLHILAAIVGFGGLVLNGVHGAQARRRKGAEGLAITESTIAVSNVALHAVYLVFALGVALVLVSDGTWKFGQLWIGLSMALYAVGVGLSHGVLRPNVERMRDLMAELVAGSAAAPGGGGPPPQAAELEQRARTVGIVSAVLNLDVVAILFLMVWKPL